jgi:hypothetical protein
VSPLHRMDDAICGWTVTTPDTLHRLSQCADRAGRGGGIGDDGP